MIHLFLILASLHLAPAETAPELNPLNGPESLKYNMYIFGVHSGEAILGAIDYGSTILLTGQVDSVGLFNSMYPVHNYAECHLDPATFAPTKYVMKSNENHIISKYLLKFNQKKRTILRIKTKAPESGKWTAKRSYKIVGYPAVYDYLSALMFVRSRLLKKDKEYYFFGFSGNFLYKVKFSMVGKDQVFTEKGIRKGLKVKADITRWRVIKDRPSGSGWTKTMNMWFTDDDEHTPLKISVDLFVGSVTVVLAN